MSRKTRNSRNTNGARKNDWIILGAGVVAVVALVTFVMIRSKSRTTEGTASPAPAVSTAPVATDHDHGAESSIRRITAAELRAAMIRGEATVVDVRDADSYAAGHVAGSLHIPLSFVESQVSYLPRDRMLVTYCT